MTEHSWGNVYENIIDELDDGATLLGNKPNYRQCYNCTLIQVYEPIICMWTISIYSNFFDSYDNNIHTCNVLCNVLKMHGALE